MMNRHVELTNACLDTLAISLPSTTSSSSGAARRCSWRKAAMTRPNCQRREREFAQSKEPSATTCSCSAWFWLEGCIALTKNSLLRPCVLLWIGGFLAGARVAATEPLGIVVGLLVACGASAVAQTVALSYRHSGDDGIISSLRSLLGDNKGGLMIDS